MYPPGCFLFLARMRLTGPDCWVRAGVAALGMASPVGLLAWSSERIWKVSLRGPLRWDWRLLWIECLEALALSSGLYYKCFTIVIYNCSDSRQYYKTIKMIISYAPNLALALGSVINYDHKWRHNLERHLLTIVLCLWYRSLVAMQFPRLLSTNILRVSLVVWMLDCWKLLAEWLEIRKTKQWLIY